MYEDAQDWKMPDWFFSEHEIFSLHPKLEGWQYPTKADLRKLQELVAQTPDEKSIQKLLQDVPILFQAQMRTGHGNWVFPQFSFGGKFIADFICCHGTSGGPMYNLIELESPRAKPHLKDGRFSEATRIAIDQIKDWRRYAEQNLSQLWRPKAQGGLGLHLFRAGCFATIIIGRRANDYPARFQGLRAELRERDSIEIISYDTFVENIQNGIARKVGSED